MCVLKLEVQQSLHKDGYCEWSFMLLYHPILFSSALLALRQYAECFILRIARPRQSFDCLKVIHNMLMKVRLYPFYSKQCTYYFISSKAISYTKHFIDKICFRLSLFLLYNMYVFHTLLCYIVVQHCKHVSRCYMMITVLFPFGPSMHNPLS